MKHKFLLIYTWLIKTVFYFFPDIPLIMRLRGFFYSLGMKKAKKNFQVAHNVVLNTVEDLSVGQDVYIAMGTVILAGGKIEIGDGVMIGPGCLISAGNHTLLNNSYRFGPAVCEPVHIGTGSWISGHCVVLPGVKFPEKSVAAAGCVITKGLEDNGNGIYGGIPAKFIKHNI